MWHQLEIMDREFRCHAILENIYKQYDDQQEKNEDLIFIGQDSRSHTATNENITLNVGN